MNPNFNEAAGRVSEKASEAFESTRPFLREAMNKSRKYVDAGRGYYSDAARWASQNQGLSIAFGSALLGGLFIGYFIGKSRREESPIAERLEELEDVAERTRTSVQQSLSPFFKFLKLYYLYRVNV